MFNTANIMMIARYVLMAIGGGLAAKGFIPQEAVSQATDLVIAAAGAIVTAGTFIWGLRTNTVAARVAQVASLPDVDAVVTKTRGLAQSIPASNVVPAADVTIKGG